MRTCQQKRQQRCSESASSGSVGAVLEFFSAETTLEATDSDPRLHFYSVIIHIAPGFRHFFQFHSCENLLLCLAHLVGGNDLIYAFCAPSVEETNSGTKTRSDLINPRQNYYRKTFAWLKERLIIRESV